MNMPEDILEECCLCGQQDVDMTEPYNYGNSFIDV